MELEGSVYSKRFPVVINHILNFGSQLMGNFGRVTWE